MTKPYLVIADTYVKAQQAAREHHILPELWEFLWERDKQFNINGCRVKVDRDVIFVERPIGI